MYEFQSLTLRLRLGALLIIGLVFAGIASAADRPIFTHKGVAIRGADPVAYFSLEAGADSVQGSPDISLDYLGSTWRFASEQNRAVFAADPQKFAPQYGGYCAFAVARGFTKPINPDAWYVKDDKLYLNLSKRVRKRWLKDVDEAIVQADGHWPTALMACEKRNKCSN